jgi:transcription termination factor NusA
LGFDVRAGDQTEALIALIVQSCNTSNDEAKALVNDGFRSIEEIAYVPHWEIANTAGIDPERVSAIRSSARKFLLRDLP